MSTKPLVRTFVIFVLLCFLAGVVSGQGDRPVPPTDPDPTEEAPADPVDEVPVPDPDVTAPPVEEPTEPPPAEDPTEEPVEDPTEEATEPPVEDPTEPPPTEEATEPPVIDPTEEPADPPVDEAIEEPLSALPAFQPIEGTPFTIAPGESIGFVISVQDDEGVVRLVAGTDNTAGAIVLASTAPVEETAPFTTIGQVDYTAAADFTGLDTFTVTAIDADGQQVVITVTVQVLEAVDTVEPPVEVTEEPTFPTPPPTEEPVEETTVESLNYVERLIVYDPAASEESIDAMLDALGAIELERIPAIGSMHVRIPLEQGNKAQAMAAMSGNSAAMAAGLQAIEEQQMYYPHWDPNDEYVPLQWSLSNMYVKAAWDINTRRGSGVTVAVLDTGVDLQHPDLAGKLVAGWDFVDDDSVPDDISGHGTHVAGIIGARTNNRIGIAGVAPNARIMPVRVLGTGGGYTWQIVSGIVFAVDKGAEVINMSLGTCVGPSTAMEAAVNYALTQDVVIVASAGNGNGQYSCPSGFGYSWPASYDGVISVAANDINNQNGYQVDGYNYNDKITVSAPGFDIYSLWPVEYGSYTYLSGTSMAAPQVSGVAALIIAARVAQTPETVREAIVCGAWDIGTSGYDNYSGWGVVQADYSLNWRFNSTNCQIPQANDNFEDAERIRRAPFETTVPVSSRSVSNQITDPALSCVAAQSQTLWYEFKPSRSNMYQIHTLGSSYDTAVAVFQGQAGALNEIGCDNHAGVSDDGNLMVPLNRRETYYIAVVTESATPVNSEVMLLGVQEGIKDFRRDQENSRELAFIGSWERTRNVRATVMETTDNSAMLAFTVRGNSLALSRTRGPGRGSWDVYVDDAFRFTISNRAAFDETTEYNFSLGGESGQWHKVGMVRNDATAGPVDFDYLDPYDSNETRARGNVDDRDAYLVYAGNWTEAIVDGAYRSTVKYTTQAGAWVQANIANSDTIVVYRSTNPAYGYMEVWVDGQYYAGVDNDTSTGVSVPFVITGLAQMDHTVRIYNGGSSQLHLDRIEGKRTSQLKAGRSGRWFNAKYSHVLLSGLWEYEYNTLAYGRYFANTSDPAAELNFRFEGNYLAINYYAKPTTASFDIWIDGAYYDTVDTYAASPMIAQWASGLMYEGIHSVQIFQNFFDTGPLSFDAIYAGHYDVLNADRRFVDDRDNAFSYTGDWYYWVGARSTGGFRAQRGSLQYISGLNVTGTVSFFMDGTGFLLYTSVGIEAGWWEVWVDGVRVDIIEYGTTYTTFDLYAPRYTPATLAVSGLSPGIHYVTLIATTPTTLPPEATTTGFVDFDGIRVFP